MGSHGGATAAGQAAVLSGVGSNRSEHGLPAAQLDAGGRSLPGQRGLSRLLRQYAFAADHVLVVNRIKPHTRFAGAIESGLMKMMLIGLGKQTGAEVYHRAIVNYSFDQIVRSVANTVIERCHILAGSAILENAYEETAEVWACVPNKSKR